MCVGLEGLTSGPAGLKDSSIYSDVYCIYQLEWSVMAWRTSPSNLHPLELDWMVDAILFDWSRPLT